MEYILFMLGVILIISGSYCFRKVNCFIPAVSIALIGITIVASILENNEIVIGTLLGNNMFLLLVIIGRIFISEDKNVEENNLFTTLSYAIVVSAIILYLSGNYFSSNSSSENYISTSDGIILLIIAFAYIIMYFVNIIRTEKYIYYNNTDIQEHDSRNNIEIIKYVCLKNKNIKAILADRMICLYMIAGGILCMTGAALVTVNSYKIAVNIKISQNVLSVFIINVVIFISIMIGSSINTKKENTDNIRQYKNSIGKLIACIINITIIMLGMSSIICNIKITMYNIYDMMFLTVSYILVWLLLKLLKKNVRIAGCVMITMYIAYMVFVLKR